MCPLDTVQHLIRKACCTMLYPQHVLSCWTHTTLCKFQVTDQHILHFPLPCCTILYSQVEPTPISISCTLCVISILCSPPQAQCHSLFLHWSSVNANIWRQHVARYSVAMKTNFQNDKKDYEVWLLVSFRIEVSETNPEEKFSRNFPREGCKYVGILKTLLCP